MERCSRCGELYLCVSRRPFPHLVQFAANGNIATSFAGARMTEPRNAVADLRCLLLLAAGHYFVGSAGISLDVPCGRQWKPCPCARPRPQRRDKSYLSSLGNVLAKTGCAVIVGIFVRSGSSSKRLAACKKGPLWDAQRPKVHLAGFVELDCRVVIQVPDRGIDSCADDEWTSTKPVLPNKPRHTASEQLVYPQGHLLGLAIWRHIARPAGQLWSIHL